MLSTVGSGKTYATLAAWYAANGAPAFNTTQDAECYSGSDLGTLDISNDMDTQTFNIYAAVGHQHNGIDVGNAGVAYLSGLIYVEPHAGNSFITVRGLRVEGAGLYALSYSGDITVTFERNLIINNVFSPGIDLLAYTDGDNSTIVGTVRNNVVYCKGAPGTSSAGIRAGVSAGDGTFDAVLIATIVNNTVLISEPGTSKGIIVNGDNDGFEGGTLSVENNIVSGARVADYENNWPYGITASGYNLSSDSTASAFGATGSVSGAAGSSVVVDVLTNATLKTTSPAKDVGTTRGEFSTDAIGILRPQGGAWDMGALELVVAAVVGRLRRSRILRFWRH